MKKSIYQVLEKIQRLFNYITKPYFDKNIIDMIAQNKNLILKFGSVTEYWFQNTLRIKCMVALSIALSRIWENDYI